MWPKKSSNEHQNSLIYDRIPFKDDSNTSEFSLEKQRFLDEFPETDVPQKPLQRIYNELHCTIVIPILSIILLITTITIFTTTLIHQHHNTTLKSLSLSQHNSIRPTFKDHKNGPIELSGSQRCGSFPSEAENLGCIFDIMNYGFTAPECYYPSVALEAQENGPWRWFMDQSQNHPIPQDDKILSRSVEVWTELEYHIVHCMYTQRLLKMAEEDDEVLIPQEMARLGYTKHCTELVRDYRSHNLSRVNTWIRMIYNPCVRLSEIGNEIVE